MNIKKLYKKHKDIIPYLFFGVCTTIINVAIYWIATHIFNMPIMIGTILAWFLAVLFAYITNRKWVFHSKTKTIQEIGKEVISFFICRILTGIVDWTGMFLGVNIFALNDIIIKFSTNIVVIVLNYIASKLLNFVGKSKDEAI